jgi:hypothetical protein
MLEVCQHIEGKVIRDRVARMACHKINKIFSKFVLTSGSLRASFIKACEILTREQL